MSEDPPTPLQRIAHGGFVRAAATGRVAAQAARLGLRRVLGRDPDDADALIGQKLAQELDQMKGLAMKVGQILSYMDGAVPPQVQEALRGLQRGGQPVAWEVLAGVVQEALGAPVAALFDSLDTVPAAAASVGQVHRGVYLGQPVAVKIQYPYVRATLSADFARISNLASLASLATRVDGPALARELRDRMLDECDYRREAAHQDLFANAYAADPDVRIPGVVHERTAETVITTAWADGEDFYTFLDRASQAEKNHVAKVLVRFAYTSLFGLGVLNADPHPGNYLFPQGTQVVFLDFGCVRVFTDAELDPERALMQTVLNDDRAGFRDALVNTGMVPDPHRFDFDLHYAMMRHLLEPYWRPTFQFTAEHIRRAMEYNQPSNPNLRRLAIPPAWIWQQRLMWGLHAVLARLDAQGGFSDVMRQALATRPGQGGQTDLRARVMPASVPG